MEKTDRLYQTNDSTPNVRFYNYYVTADTDVDSTWQMQCVPYPPEPNYDFIVEEDNIIKKVLCIWEGYVQDLTYFAFESNLLECKFGQFWHSFIWMDNDIYDWKLTQSDVNDFLLILHNINFSLPIEKQFEHPEYLDKSYVQDLEELRSYLLNYFGNIVLSKCIIYLRRA